jgi:hypothetical protein
LKESKESEEAVAQELEDSRDAQYVDEAEESSSGYVSLNEFIILVKRDAELAEGFRENPEGMSF